MTCDAGFVDEFSGSGLRIVGPGSEFFDDGAFKVSGCEGDVWYGAVIVIEFGDEGRSALEGFSNAFNDFRVGLIFETDLGNAVLGEGATGVAEGFDIAEDVQELDLEIATFELAGELTVGEATFFAIMDKSGTCAGFEDNAAHCK